MKSVQQNYLAREQNYLARQQNYLHQSGIGGKPMGDCSQERPIGSVLSASTDIFKIPSGNRLTNKDLAEIRDGIRRCNYAGNHGVVSSLRFRECSNEFLESKKRKL